MGLFSFFRKLDAPKAKAVSDQTAKALDALTTASRVISDFGDFIRSPEYPSPGCIADTSKLPHSKEAIRNSFRLMMYSTDDENQFSALVTCYPMLADFQESIGDNVDCHSKYKEYLDKLDLSNKEDLKIGQRIIDFYLEDISASRVYIEQQAKEIQQFKADVYAILLSRAKDLKIAQQLIDAKETLSLRLRRC